MEHYGAPTVVEGQVVMGVPTVMATPLRQQFMVHVPAGAAGGSLVAVTTPDGRAMNVTVPSGLQVGQPFMVEYDAVPQQTWDGVVHTQASLPPPPASALTAPQPTNRCAYAFGLTVLCVLAFIPFVFFLAAIAQHVALIFVNCQSAPGYAGSAAQYCPPPGDWGEANEGELCHEMIDVAWSEAGLWRADINERTTVDWTRLLMKDARAGRYDPESDPSDVGKDGRLWASLAGNGTFFAAEFPQSDVTAIVATHGLGIAAFIITIICFFLLVFVRAIALCGGCGRGCQRCCFSRCLDVAAGSAFALLACLGIAATALAPRAQAFMTNQDVWSRGYPSGCTLSMRTRSLALIFYPIGAGLCTVVVCLLLLHACNGPASKRRAAV